jgi:hypothetical protein
LLLCKPHWLCCSIIADKSIIAKQTIFYCTSINIRNREIGWEAVDWINLALDREQWKALVNTVMNLRIP